VPFLFFQLMISQIKRAKRFRPSFAAPQAAPTVDPSSTLSKKLGSIVDRVLESEHPYAQEVVVPALARLGRQTRVFSARFVERWTKHALGNDVVDNAFAIAIGYSVFGVLLAIYLNVLTIGSMRSAGRAVRQTVRNQLLVAKV
jgi:E3 ubiquitin-protein ligase MARCH6